MQNVNIEQVRQYNASLKQYRDKASQIKAGIDFSNKELDRLCKELSAELGIDVTPDNIEKIRQEQIASIENTLKVGSEILNRIKNEENGFKPETSSLDPNAGALNMGNMGMGSMGGMIPPAPTIPQAPQQVQQATQQDDGTFNSLGNIPPLFGAI